MVIVILSLLIPYVTFGLNFSDGSPACVNDSTYQLISELPICSTYYSFIEAPYNDYNLSDWEEFYSEPCSSCIYSCEQHNFTLEDSCPCINYLITHHEINITNEPCLEYTYDACNHWCKVLVYNAIFIISNIEDFMVSIKYDLGDSVCTSAYSLIERFDDACSNYSKYQQLYECAFSAKTNNNKSTKSNIFTWIAVILIGCVIILIGILIIYKLKIFPKTNKKSYETKKEGIKTKIQNIISPKKGFEKLTNNNAVMDDDEEIDDGIAEAMRLSEYQ